MVVTSTQKLVPQPLWFKGSMPTHQPITPAGWEGCVTPPAYNHHLRQKRCPHLSLSLSFIFILIFCLNNMQMGFVGPRDIDQHAKKVWKDNLCLHVCSSTDLQLPKYGVQHLFNMQENFTEASEEYLQVLGTDLCRAWYTTL